MRILHFSDVHLSVPFSRVSLGDWPGKRLFGAANVLLRRRRALARSEEKVSRLWEFAAREGVFGAVCTGDCTTLGTNAEYSLARELLLPSLTLPGGLVHVPGNHDLYAIDAVRERRFERHFPGVLRSDLPDLQADGPWPLVRLWGDRVAVVAVNSARPNRLPWRSSGRVPEPQLAALGRIWAHRSLTRRFVFVVTHYAPRLADGRADTRCHGLTNADALLQSCRPLARGALLHGHVHHCYRVVLPSFSLPLFNAGSLTWEGREGLWLFEIGERSVRATPGRFRGGRYELCPSATLEW